MPTHHPMTPEPTGAVQRPAAPTIRLSCLGDSLTRGRLSVDYVPALLRHRRVLTVERFGVNGDFAYNLLQRLDPVLATPADAITVLIGTNDARAAVPGYPVARAMRRKDLPRPPSRAWFAECLAAIVERLQRETDARIALLSLPALGQVLDAAPMRAAAAYSRTIAEVAAAAGVAYLPLHERQVAELRSRRVADVAYRDFTPVRYLTTLARRTAGRDPDTVAARRRLELTTDHIHQNSRGAALIAEVIAGWLQQLPHASETG